MGTTLHSWLHYKDVRRASAAWQHMPSGLGYYDIALYALIGQRLERKAQNDGSVSRVLDLGTYFGHSAFCFAFGGSKVSTEPHLDILSIDIFEQPQWMLTHVPEVVHFVMKYGSTEPQSISHALDDACASVGLKKNPIRLMKRDVLTLSVANLIEMAPDGFDLIAVDCAKSPELMNRVSEYLGDPHVCRTGTVVAFQDLFDWHAPWNVFALSKMLDAGIFSLNCSGPRVTPFAEKIKHRDIGPICDRIAASPLPGEEWCRAFTSIENELAALDHVVRLFRSHGYTDFVYRLECLKVGAYLRAGRIDSAQALIVALDERWPTDVKDSCLQNAYCRLMHLVSGKKDLSLVFDTPGHRTRNSPWATKLRKMSSRIGYLQPIYSSQTSREVMDAAFASRKDAAMTVQPD